jgi:hypothetical protein
MMIIPTGVYRHYKGKRYLVIGVARHSETQEYLVVYVPLYDTGSVNMAVRPLGMFIEMVPDPENPEKEISRFEFVGSSD